MDLSTKHVETMNLVEDVESSDEGVISKTINLWPFRNNTGIVADVLHVLSRDGHRVDVSKLVPIHKYSAILVISGLEILTMPCQLRGRGLAGKLRLDGLAKESRSF